MKKICITLFMMVALAMSLSTYAHDNKKGSDASTATTEQAEKKSGTCCSEKKDNTCCDNKGKACCEKKDNACCAGKDKNAKPSDCSNSTLTKSCGKKG